jgi:NAD(P)H-nitrite reductase large subunit
METTVPGIFVAGETAGIAGAAVAMEEGRIAGLGAARSLGRVTDGELRVRTRGARRRLASLRRFHAGLAQLFRPRDGLVDLITPDTIVCRCEEVCGKELAQAIAAGAASLKDTRARTRAGMGPCQGRLCAPAVAALIAQRRGVPIHSIAPSSTRPPVKPVPLAALAR